MLDVAECMAHSALNRRESRGSHQRLEADCCQRDDKMFLKHSLAFMGDNGPSIQYGDVSITTYPPAKRAYGAEEKQLQQQGANV